MLRTRVLRLVFHDDLADGLRRVVMGWSLRDICVSCLGGDMECFADGLIWIDMFGYTPTIYQPKVSTISYITSDRKSDSTLILADQSPAPRKSTNAS